MKKLLISLIILLLSVGICAASGTDTKTLIIKASVGKVAKLAVDTNTITFQNMDPDVITQIQAVQDINITVKARTASTGQVNLQVVADGDLISGFDTIPIQNVTWQASGSGFINGVLSKSVQNAGSWTGSGIRQGVLRYFLNNSWNYQKGEYQTTITYTLTTP